MPTTDDRPQAVAEISGILGQLEQVGDPDAIARHLAAAGIVNDTSQTVRSATCPVASYLRQISGHDVRVCSAFVIVQPVRLGTFGADMASVPRNVAAFIRQVDAGYFDDLLNRATTDAG